MRHFMHIFEDKIVLKTYEVLFKPNQRGKNFLNFKNEKKVFPALLKFEKLRCLLCPVVSVPNLSSQR